MGGQESVGPFQTFWLFLLDRHAHKHPFRFRNIHCIISRKSLKHCSNCLSLSYHRVFKDTTFSIIERNEKLGLPLSPCKTILTIHCEFDVVLRSHANEKTRAKKIF